MVKELNLEDLQCRLELAEVLGLKNVSKADLNRHHCVDWLKAHETHFSRARTMETSDLTGIPLKSIIGPINYRPLKQLESPGLIVEPPKHRTSIARIRVATPAQLRMVEKLLEPKDMGLPDAAYEGSKLADYPRYGKPCGISQWAVYDRSHPGVARVIIVADDIYTPGEMNGQIMALKEHFKARYRLSNLIRAQKNHRLTSNLSKWIQTGVKGKGDLEEGNYKILSQFYKERKDLLYHTADGAVACRRKDEEKILHKQDLIVLPQLYQTELIFRSHDQMGHQGIDKVQQKILRRFDWPVLRNTCERWVNACLACLQVKDPRKLKFSLKSVDSSEFNEVLQIDHQKVCMTDSGYNQILVILDHFTKLAEAVPCQTASAEETWDHLITHWISRYGCPITFQSDNGKAFVGDLTKELMRRSHIA